MLNNFDGAKMVELDIRMTWSITDDEINLKKTVVNRKLSSYVCL